MLSKGWANWSKFTPGLGSHGRGPARGVALLAHPVRHLRADPNAPQDQFVFDAATDANGTVTDLAHMWTSPLGGSFYVPVPLAE